MTEEQQPVDPEDLAPDADDDGDSLPDELSNLVNEGDIVPDNVDEPDAEDQEDKASEEESA